MTPSKTTVNQAALTPTKTKFTLKKSTNPKTSPASMKAAHSKIQWVAVHSDDPAVRAIGFTIFRESSPTDSSWADKIAFDLLRDRDDDAPFKTLGVYKDLFYLHHFDHPLPGYNGFGRRVYFMFTDEIPGNHDILDLSHQIADLINGQLNMKPVQHVKVYANDLWYKSSTTFVEILGNRQTLKLANDILPGNNVAQYFQDNNGALASFWPQGTMQLDIAQRYGFDMSMVRPANAV
jgi:hypothetical protein